MFNNCLVSIVVPAFNSEKTLGRCIESLITQSYRTIEIIIVDNASTDRTFEILLEYAKADSRIIVAQEAKRGPSAARNTGLNCVHGDYVCFCDADDYYDVSFVDVMLDGARTSKADIVVCGYNYATRICYMKNKKTPSSRIDSSSREFAGRVILDQRVMGSVCNKMYARYVVDKVRFKDSVSFCEDTLFNIEAAYFINKVKYTDRVLYNYVLEGESLTRTKDHTAKEKALKRVHVFSETFERYRNTFLSDSIDAAMFSLAVRERITCEFPNEELTRWARLFFRSRYVPFSEKIKIAVKSLMR